MRGKRTAHLRHWPWVIAATTLALSPLLFVSLGSDAETLFDVAALATMMLATGALAVVGALLATRVPGNVIGTLLLAAGFLIVASSVANLYATAGSWTSADPWPGLDLAHVLGESLFIYGIVITLVGVPLVFPTGHLLGPRWRWIVGLTVLGMAALTLSVALGSESVTEGARFPLESARPEEIMVLLEGVNALTAFIAMGAAVVATLIRLRESRGIERQQMKWLAAVASVAALAMPLALVVPNVAVSNALLLVALAGFALLPIAIGIGVLRYRLYEIDRLISRTIGWAIVTGVLVGAFVLLVLGLTAVLEPLTGGNTLAVAGSTLVVAALFAPLRGRVQRAVDRRFDRSRYDGERLLDTFGERLRDEVDLTTIRTDVLTTVDAAVRPASVGLWLRGGTEERS